MLHNLYDVFVIYPYIHMIQVCPRNGQAIVNRNPASKHSDPRSAIHYVTLAKNEGRFSPFGRLLLYNNLQLTIDFNSKNLPFLTLGECAFPNFSFLDRFNSFETSIRSQILQKDCFPFDVLSHFNMEIIVRSGSLGNIVWVKQTYLQMISLIVKTFYICIKQVLQLKPPTQNK